MLVLVSASQLLVRHYRQSKTNAAKTFYIRFKYLNKSRTVVLASISVIVLV